MEFFLGTHQTEWLGRTSVPLFVSRRRLAVRKLHRALGPWALDSGGFSEIRQHGKWTIGTRQYVAEVRRWAEAIGNMRWAACMDWMCEPFMIAKTGLSVGEHQRRTTQNYLELVAEAPEQPWVPVLQGWHYADYMDHAASYGAAGIDLKALPVVGLGSVCRRQATRMVEELIQELCGRGIRLHGFGFKVKGLPNVAPYLASADSMAWSTRARKGKIKLPECNHRADTCANCMRYALEWRERVCRIELQEKLF